MIVRDHNLYLDPARLDKMVDRALMHRQMSRGWVAAAANMNLRERAGIAASFLVLAIAALISMQVSFVTPSDLTDDASEISDYVLYDMMDEAS